MNTREEPLVSIIVPVYNIAPYIEDCIESIQKQTYSNLEILVVDDGSMDGSGEICARLASNDKRIHLTRQKNAGVVTARGKGIEKASGKYIAFVDGDDWIEPDMIEELVNRIGDMELVTSGVYRQFTPERIVKRCDRFPEGRYRGESAVSAILYQMIYDFDKEELQPLTPWCYNKLYISELVKQVYKEVAADITYGEDAVFLYKYLLKCSSIVITHRCFYYYRYREESAIHAVNNHMLIDINKVYLSLEEDFRNHRLGGQLLCQLQKWVSFVSCKAINEHMGFDNRVHIPEFAVNLSGLENKRLIVYGAGSVGKDTYAQLKSIGYIVVMWADKDYRFYQGKGLPVDSPDEICNQEYDLLYIAVNEKELAERITEDLLKRGIPKTKMLWKKPMRIY